MLYSQVCVPSESVKSSKSPLFPCVIFRPFLFCFIPPPTAPKCLSCLFIHPSEGFLHYQPATALGIWHKIKIGVGTETGGVDGGGGEGKGMGG